MVISKKIKVFTLNRSFIEYFGKHCCKITYKRSLIVLHVYFFSLFPIAPLFSYRPLTALFLLTAPLNLVKSPWGVVAPTLGTTALQDENNRGWANNLQGIHFVFSNDIILSISEYFARNNK